MNKRIFCVLSYLRCDRCDNALMLEVQLNTKSINSNEIGRYVPKFLDPKLKAKSVYIRASPI